MKPIRTQDTTKILQPPADWQGSEQCEPLPIVESEWDGLQCVVSYWQPTSDELRDLVAGGAVSVCIASHGRCPAMAVKAHPASQMQPPRVTPLPRGRGCFECSYGKVAGCWKCGGRA